MLKRRLLARTGLWLTCGGLLVLASQHLLAVYDSDLSLDNFVLLGGALAGYLVTGTGIWLSMGYRARGDAQECPSGAEAVALPADHNALTLVEMTGRMTASFLAWCEHGTSGVSLWNSFDQLVREMLTEQLGALRIRCYQVLPGDQQLRRLSQLGLATEGASARHGILGHVATRGQEFVAADPTQGELVHRLAQDGEEDWEWVFPIRVDGQTTGLVAIGKLPPLMRLNGQRREALSGLVTTFWRHAACLEQLRIAESTDKGSGLLTRADFFQVATRALADSYAMNEPVVIVVLTVEGLRGLDDVGQWSERDALVETIAELIKRRMRADDIIGRFSDERFVLLLRRLDSSLGRLIAVKIQETAQAQVAQLGQGSDELHVRAGLAGSGFQKPALETLLVSAFDAVGLARRQNEALHCDLPPAGKPGALPAVNQEGVVS